MVKREILLTVIVLFLIAGFLVCLTHFNFHPKQSSALANQSDDPAGLPYAGDGIKRRIGFV